MHNAYILLLSLQETYSLCVLVYAIPALSLTTKQIDELKVCWNSVILKVFGYHKWESVSVVLLGLGRLAFTSLKFASLLAFRLERLQKFRHGVPPFQKVSVWRSGAFRLSLSTALNIMFCCSLR